MRLFMPDTVYFDPRALKYETGQSIRKYFEQNNIDIIDSKSVDINCRTPQRNYAKAKKTVLVTVNMQKKLAPCRPSADFQFSLSSSCPANCEYCYLQTTQGEKPFIKIFANIEDIFSIIKSYIDAGKPNITTFECASITDPVAVEHITGSLRKCIEFFGTEEHGRLRLVTKFPNIDSLLDAKHNGHTRFRFSLNARHVINNFEHGTASFDDRIAAAKKIASAGYPIGFIIAPIMVFDNWEKEYRELILKLGDTLSSYSSEISFELIQYRFTATAKELILSRFPNTRLDMEESERLLKWGPYGKFKYVYKKDVSEHIREYLTNLIKDNIQNSHIEYFT